MVVRERQWVTRKSTPVAAIEALPAVDQQPAATGGRRGTRWWRQHGPLLALLVLLTVVFLWPYSNEPWRGVSGWGDPAFQYWTVAWIAHALQTDPRQLYEANILYPYPHTLAFADHLVGSTLPVVPVIWLTGNAVLGYNLSVMLAFLLSAVAVYLLVADLTSSRLAGFAAALVAGFGPYKLANLGHINTVNAGAIALTAWALLRLWRSGGWGWAALLAGSLAYQAGSSVYLFYGQLVVLGVTLLYLALAERRLFSRRALLRLGVGLVAGAALVLPLFWPYLLVTRDVGAARSLDDAAQWSALPDFYLRVSHKNFLYGAGLLRDWAVGNPERQLFPGLVAPLLALVGLFGSRRRERWLWAALIVVGVVLTFGPYFDPASAHIPLPYLVLYKIVPGFTGMRVATRFVTVAILGLAALTGYGVEALVAAVWRRWRGQWALLARRWSRTAGVATVLLITVVALVEYRADSGMTGAVADVAETPMTRWLATHGTGPVLELPLPEWGTEGVWPMLGATTHWRPLVGGYTSVQPAAYGGLRDLAARFPDPEVVTLLQGLEVEQIIVRRAEFRGADLARIERLLATEPRLREVARFDSDVIYELASDPWVRRAASALPAGEQVVFPDLGSRGAEQELIGMLLIRLGHRGWGSGAVSYHTYALPGDGRLPPTAILPAGADPMLYGWLPDEIMTSRAGLTFYRCRAASPAVMLADPALARPAGATGALTVKLESDRLTVDDAGQATGQGRGEARGALIAFVNLQPGTVTIDLGGASRSEQLPAGLIVYRLPPLPTPATVRIEAPPGGGLLRRWARLEVGESGPAGQIALRPLVALTARAQPDGAGAVRLDLDLLAGAAGGDMRPVTVTLDIYQRPYGTHPDGHYGSWSVAVPADGRRHSVTLRFDNAPRVASATLDGAWAPVAAWSGPPQSGPFRASIVVTRGDRVLGTLAAYEFDLRSWQTHDLQITTPGPLTIFLPAAP